MLRLRDFLRHAQIALVAVLLLVAATAAHAAGQAAPEEPGPVGGPGVKGIEQGVEAAEHGGGLPQLDATTFPSQIFWLLVSFLALYFLLSRKALPRVEEILEARQARISGDLDRAANLRAEAEEALHRYEKVVADAQALAAAHIKETQDRLNADAAKRQAELDAQLQGRIAEAEANIAGARDAALGQIQGVAAEVARFAVQRLTGIEVTAEEAAAGVERLLREAA